MKRLLPLISLLFLSLYLNAQEDYKYDKPGYEYTNPNAYEIEKIKQVPHGKKPRNIILLIGDGMGYNHLNAALIANRGQLNITNMIYMGMIKTNSANKYITDSAAGGTALASGQKTNNGMIGLNADSMIIPSILEIAEQKKLATGLISTSAITHATPASFIAHQPKRSMYEEIAADFLKTDIDLFIGGGYTFFSQRNDGRNLIAELEKKGYLVSRTLDDLANVEQGKVAVLTANKHNPAYIQRGNMLPNATAKAITILNNNSKEGFFLMVEGSQIDWGAHQNNIEYIITETLDFDRAVGQALAFAQQDKNTLVIVTADHETGGLTISDADETTGYVKAQFATDYHTGVNVPVFAYGPGASEFIGIYENTAVFDKIVACWSTKK